MLSRCVLPAVLLFLLVSGCGRGTQQRDLRAAEHAIREADAQWLRAAQARDLEKTLSYWTEDATVIPPFVPPMKGKAALRQYVSDAFALPEFAITWTTAEVRVSAGGDMAYSTGDNQVSFRAPDGKLLRESGRAVVIWFRQADGSWKAAVDIWNPAPPGAR